MTGKYPPMRLYSGPLSMFGAKAQIAALEKRLTVELVMVPFDMARLYEPKHEEVLRINPKQQVPVLIHGEVEIFDSTQIFEYLEDVRPEPRLWPQTLAARARGPAYPYSFSVANNRDLNAFALPGGPVWIHRGILHAAADESQVAGVLAHEIAHIAQRHAADQITKQLVANGFLGLLGAILSNEGHFPRLVRGPH